MSCSLQHDSTHSNGVITVVTIVTKHPPTSMERNLLYRLVWGWSETLCIEPLSVKVEEKKVDCSFEYDSTINKQKLRVSSAHAKKVIDIPPNVSVEDAMKLYCKGWGHATSAAIGFFTKETGLLESDPQLKDAFVRYMRKKLSKRNIHLQGDKESLFNPEELRRIPRGR